MTDFAKGHGTGNDFVIVADVDGEHPLDRAAIARLCDRRTGVGGDGLLRVVHAAKHPDGVSHAGHADWFMDYYNADGSIAEMCGNGVRVFVRYLREHRLATGDVIPVATRAGIRRVDVDGDLLRVDMGPARLLGESTADVTGHRLTGRHVSMGNPHLVCRVTDPAAYDLTRPPTVPADEFPDGVNVELFTGDRDHITMRVHERGVGETMSCGTGACAAAVVALDGPGTCDVDVPGGRLTVTATDDTVTLTGPAVLTFHGTTKP
ncbi:diaminopimelate epimerase [Stackebrandtia albiflava]|nr:diaminopimelate epimerase [Stackebrandtia albiflava]